MLLFLALPLRPARAEPALLVRSATGAWVALGCEEGTLWAWRARDTFTADSLAVRIPLAGPAGGSPLGTPGPVETVACELSGPDDIHLAYGSGGAAYYARAPLGRLDERAAWQGPAGEPGAVRVAAGLVPRACALAAGARPVVAGTRDRSVVVMRCDGEWRETLTEFDAWSPVLARDAGRGLHLAFAAADGVVYQRTDDGARWLPRQVALAGRVEAGPVLALASGREPVIAAVVDGRAAIVARKGEGWSSVPLAPPPDAAAPLPSLAADRTGTVWCCWAALGRIWVARWLGEALGPSLPIGPAAGRPIAERETMGTAPDIGILSAGRALRVPVPLLSAAEERAVRFLDLLDVGRLEGLEREPAVPRSAGAFPRPAPGDLLPAGILPWGKGGKGLRAWFSMRDGDRWAGASAEWNGRGWRAPELLRLSSPRPWLQPPAGMMSVVADPEDPDPMRRYKMIAERVGSAPALLTSADGLGWGYYSEAPSMRPLCLLRDSLAPAERRWRAYGMAGLDKTLVMLDSPDREHWYGSPPPCPALPVVDATFWVEDGLVMGLLNGGRHLVAGRTGDRLALAAELPEIAGDGHGRAFAAPFDWNGKRTLFLAAPEGWRWIEMQAGRWVGLRASDEARPGVCETIPIALGASEGRRLLIDARTGRGSITVEVLGLNDLPLEGYRIVVRGRDGWVTLRWPRGKDLWAIRDPSVRLRFTLEGEARLYGFRFAG